MAAVKVGMKLLVFRKNLTKKQKQVSWLRVIARCAFPRALSELSVTKCSPLAITVTGSLRICTGIPF